MAEDYVPGYQFETGKKVGRPSPWKGGKGAYLYGWVEIYKSIYPGKSLRYYIDMVRRKHNYKESLDSLYVRYNEMITADVSFAKFYKSIVDAKREEGASDDDIAVFMIFMLKSLKDNGLLDSKIKL